MTSVAVPRVGDRVLYVLDTGRRRDWNRSSVRPAVVVAVADVEPGQMPLVNLQVFTDGELDGQRSDGQSVNDQDWCREEPVRYADNVLWRHDVAYSANQWVRTWHWAPTAAAEFVDAPEET